MQTSQSWAIATLIMRNDLLRILRRVNLGVNFRYAFYAVLINAYWPLKFELVAGGPESGSSAGAEPVAVLVEPSSSRQVELVLVGSPGSR